MSAAPLPGRSLGALEDIILSLFPSRTDIERLLFYRLEYDLDRFVGNVGMTEVVFTVLKTAAKQGWLTEFVAAAEAERPNDNRLRDWIREHLGRASLIPSRASEQGRFTSSNADRALTLPQVAPVGRKRTVYDIIEGNLAFDLTRTLLLLNEPGARAVLDADSFDAMVDAYAVDITRRPIRRYLWEISDVLLENVERAVLARLDLNNPMALESVNSWTLTCANVLNRASTTVSSNMRDDIELLRRHLTAGLVEIGASGDQPEAAVQYVLDEITACLCESAVAAPALTLSAIGHLALTGTTADLLRKAVTRIPHPSADLLESTSDREYLTEYVRAVSLQLDMLELLGIDLARDVRRYSLTMAYMTLEVLPDPSRTVRVRRSRGADQAGKSRTVHDALQDAGAQVLLLGEAGSGKTTVLRWAAVSLSREQLPNRDLHPWLGHVPFLVTLRKYARDYLPDIEELSKEVAGALFERQPISWVARMLRAGRAVILIDGLDEVAVERRGAVQQWLDKLLQLATGRATTGKSRRRSEIRNIVILTSRPAAVASGQYDLSGFRTVSLATMGQQQIARFVHDWHQATLETIEPAARLGHIERSELLSREISDSAALRDLARTPLLCAVICALNYSNPGGLPDGRIRVYSQALTMMLGRRDREKGVNHLELGADEREVVLQGLAEWFTISGLSETSLDDVTARLATLVAGLHRGTWTVNDVLSDLLERSGVLREPSPGTVDFVHRTFQEYLAAKSLVSGGGVQILEDRLDRPDWFGLICMAAGYASTMYLPHWSRLVGSIINGLDREYRRRRASPQRRNQLRTLLVGCLDASVWVEPETYRQALPYLQEAIPPRTSADVRSVIAMGAVALPLLDRVLTDGELGLETASYCVQAAAGIGGAAAIGVIATACRLFGVQLLGEVIEAWPNFDPVRYASEVFASIPTDGDLEVLVQDEGLVPYAKYLPLSVKFAVELDVVSSDFPAKTRGARIGSLKIALPATILKFDFLLEIVGLCEIELSGVRSFDITRTDRKSSAVERIDLSSGGNSRSRVAIDCSIFDAFPQLATLSIDGFTVVKNLRALESRPHLHGLFLGQECEVDWFTEQLNSSCLEELVIDSYEHRDLTPFAGCSALEEVRLWDSDLVSLAGAEMMRRLRFIDLSGSFGLVDVDLLADLPRLEEANLVDCVSIRPEAALRLVVSDVADTDGDLIGASGSLYFHEHLYDYRFGVNTKGEVDLWQPDGFAEWCDQNGISAEASDIYDEGVLVAFPDQGEICDTGEYLDGWIVGTFSEIHDPGRLEGVDQVVMVDELGGSMDDDFEYAAAIESQVVVPIYEAGDGLEAALQQAVNTEVISQVQADLILGVKVERMTVESAAESVYLTVREVEEELATAGANLLEAAKAGALAAPQRATLPRGRRWMVARRRSASLIEIGPEGWVQVRLDDEIL